MKYYVIERPFCLKIYSYMFSANFIFVVLYLKMQPTVHLSTSKAQRHCSQKEKFIQGLLAFVIHMF